MPNCIKPPDGWLLLVAGSAAGGWAGRGDGVDCRGKLGRGEGGRLGAAQVSEVVPGVLRGIAGVGWRFLGYARNDMGK